MTRPLTIWLFENQIRNSRAAPQRSPAAPGRGGRRIDDVVDFLAPSEDLHRQHRVIEPLELEIVERGGLDPGLDDAEDAAADHDLVGLGFAAQARGKIGDAADRGIFQPLLEADLAERGIADRDSDAEAEAVPAVAPALGQRRRLAAADAASMTLSTSSRHPRISIASTG